MQRANYTPTNTRCQLTCGAIRRNTCPQVKNGSNATAALQQAIDDCGGLAGGGTVLVPAEMTLLTGDLVLPYLLPYLLLPYLLLPYLLLPYYSLAEGRCSSRPR